jgi:hypothetical protein
LLLLPASKTTAESRASTQKSDFRIWLIDKLDRHDPPRKNIRPTEFCRLFLIPIPSSDERPSPSASLFLNTQFQDFPTPNTRSPNMKTTWKDIPPVPTQQEFLDIVLSRTQRKLPTQIRAGFKISRIRGM